MTRFCKNCGSELEEGSVFCEECGTKFGESGPSYRNNGAGNLFNLYNIDMIAGERIIKKSEIHPGCFVAPGIITFIGFLWFLIIVIRGSYYFGFGAFSIGIFSNPLLIIGIFWLIVRFIAYTNNDLILTNKRVFGKCGLISTTQMQCPLNKINSVSFTNGLMGKLLGYGTVRISSGATQFKFRFIREGQSLYSDIFHNLEIAEKEKMFENAESIADAIGRRID